MKIILFFLAFTSATMCIAQSDADQVKQVVTSAYIEGIQNNGPIEDIKNGFHPSFNMLRLMDNDIKPLPIGEWIAAIEKRRQENPAPPVNRTEGKFLAVEVEGNAATVKLELHRGGKLIFTDFLSLYKFNEGWKIVSKTFYRHP
jgi:hypothetical protein